MTDSEPMKKKTIKHKKLSREIVGVLKKSVGAIIIIQYILDLRINLTIGKLLASAKTIK